MNLLGVVAWILLAPQAEPASKPAADPVVAWFESGAIPELELSIGDKEVARLRQSPKEYVSAELTEKGGGFHGRVALKLKGSAGSFRDLEDKPGFTIDVDREKSSADFHGLVKFHLNNSVQDGSYLNEFAGYEIFRRSGLPAPRITHAIVRLNGRSLGLYVLKESYDRRFLARFFERSDGNLYDGGVNGEVDDELDRDSGDGPLDRADLKRLAAACHEENAKKRRERVAALVDLDRFLTFMALEAMLAHWDGYTPNQNNWRVYFDPKTKKAVFIPHGMDQIFGDHEAPIVQHPVGIVARAVMADPECQTAYHKRLRDLLPLLFPSKDIEAAVRRKSDRLLPVVEKSLGADFAARLRAEADVLLLRIRARSLRLLEESKRPLPEPLDFTKGPFALRVLAWQKRQECDDANLDIVGQGDDRRMILKTGTCGRCIQSYRSRIPLPAGSYRFRATMTARSIRPLADTDNAGAGIRISGERRSSVFSGDAVDSPQSFDFTVEDGGRDVELVIELRASSGEITLPLNGLFLERR